MHWYDWMTLAIVVVGTIVQTVRGSKSGGMGLPMFEGLGLVVAAVATAMLSGPLAEAVRMQKSVVMIVMFLVLGVLAFICGRWLFSLTGLSFQSLDGFFNVVFGLVGAWAIAHMVLRIVIESQGHNGEVMSQMANSPVAREVFTFRTWNALMRLLFRAKLGPDLDPDIG